METEAKKRLGELLIQENIVSQETINDALRVQVGGNRRLGHILLQMGAVSDDQLATILSQQLQIPLTDIDQEFSEDAKQILPRYLCTKYSALPLTLQNNNILLTAMADPSDQQAIGDIENYTGKVVEACLARQSDITKAISTKIPYSIKDILNPQCNTRFNRALATVALVLAVIIGVTTYNYIHTAKYGTVTRLSDSTLYEHHDLMLDFNKTGKISFLGHSAFSDGYYSVEFNNIKGLKTFIHNQKNDFSVKQNQWLEWILDRERSFNPPGQGIAINNR